MGLIFGGMVVLLSWVDWPSLGLRLHVYAYFWPLQGPFWALLQAFGLRQISKGRKGPFLDLFRPAYGG